MELLPLDFWLVPVKRWREPRVNSQVHCLQTQLLVACQSGWSSNSVTPSISCISNTKQKLMHAHVVPSKATTNSRYSSCHRRYRTLEEERHCGFTAKRNRDQCQAVLQFHQFHCMVATGIVTSTGKQLQKSKAKESEDYTYHTDPVVE